ncbi:Uncharacterised protein [Serratia fonticola]|nr:Uncharacterised protein [Serratia fonticola]
MLVQVKKSYGKCLTIATNESRIQLNGGSFYLWAVNSV